MQTRQGRATARAVDGRPIAEHQVRQVDATQFLIVSGPRVEGLVSDRTAKFTIDTAAERISRKGRPASACSAVGRLFLSAQPLKLSLSARFVGQAAMWAWSGFA